MSAEAIYKLQPHRTMHLRGFDGRGAAGALHSASASGFTVSGEWSAADDVCVLTVWDADDYFEHPRMKYLPDFDFSGMTLQFDVEVANCVRIDDDRYRWTDWWYLDVVYEDGGTEKIDLAAHAVPVTGTYASASATFTLTGTITNQDYVELVLWGHHYTHLVWYYETLEDIVAGLAAAINAEGVFTAAVDGASITITAPAAWGINGNRIAVQGLVSGGQTEVWAVPWQRLSGGDSPSVWRVTLDFDADFVGSDIRKMWLTFAPALYDGAFPRMEWSVEVSGWTVTGANRALKVAGPGSVRVGSRDSWCSYTGTWAEVGGWYHRGFAQVGDAGATVTVRYVCGAAHDLYIGTALYSSLGSAAVTIDGAGAGTLSAVLVEDTAVVTRRRVASGLAAGAHTVVLTVAAGPFYFDFLEAAVLGDVPDAPETLTDVALATDYDTDHTYKLSPQRLVWNLARLGLAGRVNHYLGVFWWAPRWLVGGTVQETRVTFSGGITFSEYTEVVIGDLTLQVQHTVAMTHAALARLFADRINQVSTVFWARSDGGVLTIRGRAQAAAYRVAITATTTDALMTVGVVTDNLSVSLGTWVVDDEVDPGTNPALNRAARDWHADFFAELAAAGMGCVCALSMEMVYPPDAWAARYPDGTAVETATGFGTVVSTHCAFGSGLESFQAEAYSELAAAMVAAGLAPWLQFGEFCWWYFASGGGMAFYDAATAAAAVTALGRALVTFTGPGDDPAVNGYADAGFLRARLKAHVDAIRTAVLAVVGTAQFELLWPLDVQDTAAERLSRYVNLPVEWEGAGDIDGLKVEGLGYGAVNRDLDGARAAMRYASTELNWAAEDVWYLMPWFNGGCPWEREYLMAGREGLGGVGMWAWDHLALMGWPLPLPEEGRRSSVLLQ